MKDKDASVAGGQDGAQFAQKQKRLNKQDIKKLIEKSMTKVKEALDVDIKLINLNGQNLQDAIN